jgi:cell division protein FtsI (penicillin-binding protein 3)
VNYRGYQSSLGQRIFGERSTIFLPRHRGRRIRVFFIVPVIWALILVARLASLQIVDVARWRDWAEKQHLAKQIFSSYRDPIVDRWDRPLAVSIPVESLSVRPGLVDPNTIDTISRTLAPILDMSSDRISEKLRVHSPFVWLKRHLPMVVAQKVSDLQLRGLEIVKESRRAYPYREAASVLLGRVGLDGRGLSGLEQRFDERLRGSTIQSPMLRDAKGNMIASPASMTSVAGTSVAGTKVGSSDQQNLNDGSSSTLRLTIDAEIQAIMADELEKAHRHYRPKGAFALMVDSDSGEVLGLAQAPSVNLNADTITNPDALKNLVVEATFEPGSVMKPIVAAAAIDSGLVKPDEVLDCENGRYKFGGHWVRDTHPLKQVSVREIVVRSSNIGMGKIGERLGPDGVYDALKLFGFGSAVDLGLPGGGSGILRNVKNWAAVDVATHSFGQGVSVTAPQMVRAYSVIANGGRLIPIHLISGGVDQPSRRILSESTAIQIQSILRGVVDEEGGTGRAAAIPGVIIGGKTGTAQKTRGNGRVGYEKNKFVTSFIGFAQGASIGLSQNVVLMVVVDAPRGRGSMYGGTVAAPVFNAIIRRTLRYLSTSKELGKRGGDNSVERSLYTS